MRFDAVPLEVGGRPFFLCYSLGALQVLQRRLGLSKLSEVLERVQSVLPGASPEDDQDETGAAAAAIRDQTLRTNLDDLAEVLWTGLYHSGIADHYKSPNHLLCTFSPGDLPRLLTAIGAAAALGFARPESEAREAGAMGENPQPAAPNPSA